MQSITISFDDGFIIPDSIKLISLNTWKTIIQTISFNNCDSRSEQQINDDAKKNIANLEIDDIRDSHNDAVDKLNSEIKSLNTKINTLELNNTNLQYLIQSNKQSDSEFIKSQISDIKTSLQPVLKFYGEDNYSKGKAGEQTIINYLNQNDRFTDAIITDKSKTAESGDIYFRWNKMRCLIEVKNKKLITIDDVNKFIRDIELSDNINCGIFVTLQTAIIPGKSRDVIQFDIIKNIPVIYTFVSSPKDINYAISCLEKIMSFTINSDDNIKCLLTYFTSYYNDVQANIKDIEGAIVQNKKDLKKLTKKLDKYNTTYCGMKDDYIQFNNVDDVDAADAADAADDANATDDADSTNYAAATTATANTQVSQTERKNSGKSTSPKTIKDKNVFGDYKTTNLRIDEFQDYVSKKLKLDEDPLMKYESFSEQIKGYMIDNLLAGKHIIKSKIIKAFKLGDLNNFPELCVDADKLVFGGLINTFPEIKNILRVQKTHPELIKDLENYLDSVQKNNINLRVAAIENIIKEKKIFTRLIKHCASNN